MTIADFTLTRQLTYRNGAPADGTRRLYAIYRLGGTVFAGAGHYDNATRDRLNAVGSWYGYPESNVVVPRSTVPRSSFPALAGYRGNARTLQIAVGCFNGTVKTAVHGGRGRRHREPALRRAGRPQRPDHAGRVDRGLRPARRRPALGLRRGHARRQRQRRHPPRRDHRRHRRRRQRRRRRGLRAGARTATGATCSFRLAKACPNLNNETVRPTSLAAGQRTLKVRVTDAGGNVLEQGPYAVNVATPSDRGPLNGSGATEDGKLTAHFTGTTKTRRTVDYRSRASISGRLLNSSGKPITGALLRVLTRDRRQSARFVQR